MDNIMDNIINRDIIYGPHPPKGMYFTVSLEYNLMHPIFDKEKPESNIMLSQPIESFPAAMDKSSDIAKLLVTKQMPNSIATDVDPSQSGGYHCIIHDQSGLIMARLGIDVHDCRQETWM